MHQNSCKIWGEIILDFSFPQTLKHIIKAFDQIMNNILISIKDSRCQTSVKHHIQPPLSSGAMQFL